MRVKASILKFGLPAVLVVICGIAGAAYIAVPKNVEKQIEHGFQSLGISADKIPQPSSHTFGELEYEDLKLDADSFLTIDKLRLSYDPISISLTKTFKSIDLEGLRVIEEIKDLQTPKPETLSNIKRPSGMNAKNINITNAQITTQTPYGGVTIGLDAAGRIENNALSLQSSFYLTHKSLRLKGQGQGIWNADGWWQHDFEIPQVTIDTPDLKMTRASGALQLSGSDLASMRFQGDLRSDGLSLANHPWKSGALTLQGTLQEPEIFLAGKSAGESTLELSLTIPNLYDPKTYNGTLFAETPESLKSFFAETKAIDIPEGSVEKLPVNGATEIIFEKSQNQLISNIKNNGKSIDLEIENGQQKNLISDTQKFSAYPKDWPLSLSGNITIKGSQDENTVAEIADARLAMGEFRVNIADGVMEQGKAENWLSCSVEKLWLNHSCATSLAFINGKPALTQTKLRIANGELNLSDSNAQGSEIKITLINLEDLFKELNLPEWSGKGMMSGTADIIRRNGRTILQKATLKNHNAGVLKIKDDAFLRILTANEEEQALIHEALKNLHYDQLKLQMQNIGEQQYRFQVSATGKNPKLMQGRKFALSFDFESDLKIVKSLFLESP